MALHTLPKVYAHLEGSDNIRWVNQERVWLWEEKGWAVNKAKGREYGGDDSILMIREGFDDYKEPKVKKGGRA